MKVIKSFPPVLPDRPKILLLGSMPGVKSLQAGEYYAHPQNQFWTAAAEIFSFSPCAPYAARIGALKRSGVALWDVIESCERDGSSDEKIASEKPNRIDGLLVKNPSVRAIFFNGHSAERFFRRHFPRIKTAAVCLPSTSPRNALKTADEKIAVWKKAITPFL